MRRANARWPRPTNGMLDGGSYGGGSAHHFGVSSVEPLEITHIREIGLDVDQPAEICAGVIQQHAQNIEPIEPPGRAQVIAMQHGLACAHTLQYQIGAEAVRHFEFGRALITVFVDNVRGAILYCKRSARVASAHRDNPARAHLFRREHAIRPTAPSPTTAATPGGDVAVSVTVNHRYLRIREPFLGGSNACRS